MKKQKWFEATVEKIDDAGSETKRFWLKADTPEAIDFIPGQFIVVDLPIGNKRLDRWRSYSIANIPNESNIIELCVVRLAGGLASSYFFDVLRPGMKLKCKYPEGGFTLPQDLNRTNVMIATGTGIVPFRSMLLYIEKELKVKSNVRLIFGTRYSEDILYAEDIKRWLLRDPSFNYTLCLSRESEDKIALLPQWLNARAGYVHSAYLDWYEGQSDVHFYICGWSAMIDEVVANLVVKMGVPKGNIHYELYGEYDDPSI